MPQTRAVFGELAHYGSEPFKCRTESFDGVRGYSTYLGDTCIVDKASEDY